MSEKLSLPVRSPKRLKEHQVGIRVEAIYGGKIVLTIRDVLSDQVELREQVELKCGEEHIVKVMYPAP